MYHVLSSSGSCYAANIAFVLFSKWKAAEEALAALHGTKPMESAVNPLVVKFADGKPKTSGSQGVGLKRGNDVDAAGLNKRANLGAVRFFSQHR